MPRRGIIFVASGEHYIRHAVMRAERSLTYNSVPHVIFCSEFPKQHTRAMVELFVPTKNFWLDRIGCMERSPFDETIYLDDDCSVLEPIGELFDLLSVYEMAAAHAPGYRGAPDPEVPACFFELNFAVFPYRRSAVMSRFFRTWAETYRAWYHRPPFPYANAHDQPSFRRTVWTLGIPIYVLGPEYNWRPAFPSFLVGKAKILHGYNDDPDRIAAIGNGAVGRPRAFEPLMPHLTDLTGADGKPGEEGDHR